MAEFIDASGNSVNLAEAKAAFGTTTFAKSADGWTVAFPNHDTYVQKQDDIKRQQLVKAVRG